MSHDMHPIAPRSTTAPFTSGEAHYWTEGPAPWAAPHAFPGPGHLAPPPSGRRPGGVTALVVLASLGVAKLATVLAFTGLGAVVIGQGRYAAFGDLMAFLWVWVAVLTVQLIAGVVALVGSVWVARANHHPGPVVVTVAMGVVTAVSVLGMLGGLAGGQLLMSVSYLVDVVAASVCIALVWTSSTRSWLSAGRRRRQAAFDRAWTHPGTTAPEGIAGRPGVWEGPGSPLASTPAPEAAFRPSASEPPVAPRRTGPTVPVAMPPTVPVAMPPTESLRSPWAG